MRSPGALLAVLVGVVLSAPVLADESTPAAAARGAPLTSLEAGPLSRADRVVAGRARMLAAPARASYGVASVVVERVLVGPEAAAGERLTVFVRGPHNTADPKQPFAPYIEAGVEARYVLFLVTTRAGGGFVLDSAFALDGPEGDEKLSVLATEVALARLPDRAERAKRTLGHLLDLAGGDAPWSRSHAARELNVLAKAAAEVFTDAVAREIEALRRRSRDATVRGFLATALAATGREPSTEGEGAAGLGETPAPRPAPVPASSGTTPEAFALRRRLAEAKDAASRCEALSALAVAAKAGASPDLEAALADADPAVRERAAVLLGDVGARDAWPRLRARLAGEAELVVRVAIVRAAGLLGDDSDVAWVVARGSEPGLRPPAAMALARLRTAEALETLAAWRRQALEAAVPDVEFARQLQYLREPAFVAAERVAGRTVGPRPASAPASPEPREPR
jgi:hypothetical protein